MALMAYDPERLSHLYTALMHLLDRLKIATKLLEFEHSYNPEVHHTLSTSIITCARHMDHVQRILISNVNLAHIVPSPLADYVAREMNVWIGSHRFWWAEATHGQETRIDEFLQLILQDPHSAGKLIDATDFLAPLIYGAHDTELVLRLWLTATNPLTTSVELAGIRLRRLLTAIFDKQDWDDGMAATWIDPIEKKRISTNVRSLLGDICAPWQLQFTGLAEQWDWTAQDGAGQLQKIAEKSQAAQALATGLAAAVYRNLLTLPEDEQERFQQIDNVAFAIGASTEILRQAQVNEERQRSANLATLINIPAYLPFKFPWPTSIIIGRSTHWLGQQFNHTDEVVRRAAWHEVESRDLLAAVAVGAVWNSAVSAGRADPTMNGQSSAMQRELQHTKDSVSNAAGKGDALVVGL